MTQRWSTVQRLLLIAVFVMLAALVPAVAASAQGEQARIRVVHASPDAPNVDIWVNGSVAVSNLAFNDATDYIALAAGEYDIAVTPTGGTAADAVIEATLTLAAGMDYTVAAVGQVAEIAPLVLEDNNAAPASGKAHIRVVHASPDAPNVDVAVAGGPILIENLAFPTASNYLPVDAGSYDLDVRPTGTETVAIDINGFMAEAGTIYTVFATGLLADGSLGVLPLVDATNPATTTPAPSMPATGAGGMAADSAVTTGWLVAFGAVIALAMTTGGLVLARRTASR
ncbi:MAG TPA: DUF4397 domain-containing protein [Thermomicrobiales bacterium]|nr:DUF4397 domain-containing protein [Thermomicrobiales bacterium]